MHSDMSQQTKQEVLARLRRRYSTAGREHKVKLLNQAVELLGITARPPSALCVSPKPKG
jgi:hypothetical protein